jgi:hypothetical protein
MRSGFPLRKLSWGRKVRGLEHRLGSPERGKKIWSTLNLRLTSIVVNFHGLSLQKPFQSDECEDEK